MGVNPYRRDCWVMYPKSLYPKISGIIPKVFPPVDHGKRSHIFWEWVRDWSLKVLTYYIVAAYMKHFKVFFSFLFVSAFIFTLHTAAKLVLKYVQISFWNMKSLICLRGHDLAHKVWYFTEKCTSIIHYNLYNAGFKKMGIICNIHICKQIQGLIIYSYYQSRINIIEKKIKSLFGLQMDLEKIYWRILTIFNKKCFITYW